MHWNLGSGVQSNSSTILALRGQNHDLRPGVGRQSINQVVLNKDRSEPGHGNSEGMAQGSGSSRHIYGKALRHPNPRKCGHVSLQQQLQPWGGDAATGTPEGSIIWDSARERYGNPW